MELARLFCNVYRPRRVRIGACEWQHFFLSLVLCGVVIYNIRMNAVVRQNSEWLLENLFYKLTYLSCCLTPSTLIS